MYKMICWICKINYVDSKEHKYKKDLLKKIAFNSSNKSDKPYLFNLNNSGGLLQGPASEKVQYDNIICSICNNQYSQPWDKAYSKFINFFIQDTCITHVNFKQIFGINYIKDFINLYKYFTKSLGCALVNGSLELPINFPNPLKDLHFENFKVTFCRCDSAQIFLNIMREKLSVKSPLIDDNMLGKGSLQVTYSKSYFEETGNKIATSAVWWESVGDLRIWYWYNRKPIGKFGFVLSDPDKKYPIKEANLTYKEIKQYDDLLYRILVSNPLLVD